MTLPKIPASPMVDDDEEDLLDVQADVWMSLMTSAIHGVASGTSDGKLFVSLEGLVKTIDILTGAYMDRFKNGLPGQDPPGSRSEPPPAPVKGRNPKAGDDD